MTTFTRDLFNNLDPLNILAESTIASDTITAGASVDMQFFYALLFFLTNIDVTVGDISLLIEDSDDDITFAAVEDKFLIGTEAGTLIDATNTGKTSKIGYRGPKQYVRASLVSANSAASDGAGIKAVLGGARHLPLDTQIS